MLLLGSRQELGGHFADQLCNSALPGVPLSIGAGVGRLNELPINPGGKLSLFAAKLLAFGGNLRFALEQVAVFSRDVGERRDVDGAVRLGAWRLSQYADHLVLRDSRPRRYASTARTKIISSENLMRGSQACGAIDGL
jgi:hypothetical protein